MICLRKLSCLLDFDITLIGTEFTLICKSGHKRVVQKNNNFKFRTCLQAACSANINFKFRTCHQAACLIIVSAYIHYHPQIPYPLVKQLGAIKTQLSHIAHARPIGTVQFTVKLAQPQQGCLCTIGVNSVEREISWTSR